MRKRVQIISLVILLFFTSVLVPFNYIYADENVEETAQMPEVVPTPAVTANQDAIDWSQYKWEPVYIPDDAEFDYTEYMDEDNYEGDWLTLDLSDDGLLMAGSNPTAETGLYKSQLSGMALQIYQGFEALGKDATNANGIQVVVKGSSKDDPVITNAADEASRVYFPSALAYARDNFENVLNNQTNGAGLSRSYSYNSTSCTLTITVRYTRSNYYSQTLEQQVKAKVDSVVAAAPSGRYEAVKYFHDWLVNTNQYDTPALSVSQDSERAYYAHTQIGCLIKGTGVCESYAKSFKIFCQRVGIPCLFVSGTGNGGDHAWNYVKMEDGKWYMVDCTFDDPTGGAQVLRHTYFLVSMPRSHVVDNDFNYPDVSTSNYNPSAITPIVTPGITPSPSITPIVTPVVTPTPSPTVTPTPSYPYGQCGSDITWKCESGILSINGSGYMTDYSGYAPWYQYRDKFSSVIISEGITRVGKHAFYGCNNIKTITVQGNNTNFYDAECLKYLNAKNELCWLDAVVNIYQHSTSAAWAINNKAPNFMFINGSEIDGFSIGIGSRVNQSWYYTLDNISSSDWDKIKCILYKDGKVYREYSNMNDCFNSYYDEFLFSADVPLKDIDDVITYKFVFGADGSTPGIRYCDDFEYSLSEALTDCVSRYGNSDYMYIDMLMAGNNTNIFLRDTSRDEIIGKLKLYIGDSKYNVYQSRSDVIGRADVSAYEKVITGSQNGVVYIGSSLTLEDTVSIKHYFNIDGSVNVNNMNVYVDGSPVALKYVADNIYYLEIKNITTVNYNKIFNIKIGEIDMNYSVYSYVYDVLKRETSDDLAELGKALYLFCQSTRTHFGMN